MLTVTNLCKSYNGTVALDNVSFTINTGERVALLGANGSGKTTAIRSICQLLEWNQGEILFDGESIKKKKDYLLQIGAVLEGSRDLNWRLSAAQNAQYYAGLRGFKNKQTKPVIDNMMDRLGLTQYGNRIVGKLSTGNRQKAALLSALVHQPKLLLLDEPTLGLDIDTVYELEKVILDQSESHQQSFFITSHDMNFIDKVCTRVILLNNGQVLFDGDIKQLKQHLFHYELRISLAQSMLAKLEDLNDALWGRGKMQCLSDDKQYIVQYDRPDQALPTLVWLQENGVAPDHLTITPLSVELAYQSLMQMKE